MVFLSLMEFLIHVVSRDCFKFNAVGLILVVRFHTDDFFQLILFKLFGFLFRNHKNSGAWICFFYFFNISRGKMVKMIMGTKNKIRIMGFSLNFKGIEIDNFLSFDFDGCMKKMGNTFYYVHV